MLTDTFHDRYADVRIWETFEERDRKLLLQSFRIISEQLFPSFTYDGKVDKASEASFKGLNKKLSMELGLDNLSQFWYSLGDKAGIYTPDAICKNFVCAAFDKNYDPDSFVKPRISFIELAFRERAAQIERKYSEAYEKLEALISWGQGQGARLPGIKEDQQEARKEAEITKFNASILELNTRFERAGVRLNYHNGFIQRTIDPLTAITIERPFWKIVSGPKWKNVDIDIKEAIDRRDTGGRDPALYAAKALESVIKIISNEKGWSNGNENGAHNYIDNIGSKRSNKFIDDWEKTFLKSYFTFVRNPLGHGPGNEPMPTLTEAQTNWAIEFAMVWIKSLILRFT